METPTIRNTYRWCVLHHNKTDLPTQARLVAIILPAILGKYTVKVQTYPIGSSDELGLCKFNQTLIEKCPQSMFREAYDIYYSPKDLLTPNEYYIEFSQSSKIEEIYQALKSDFVSEDLKLIGDKIHIKVTMLTKNIWMHNKLKYSD
jgi:hypothetical protein